MLELNKIYNIDCLIGMTEIPDKSIDMIFVDLPYGVTAKNKWDNVITNVEFVRDNDVKNKDGYDETSYKIFVYAEDKHIKLAQIDGDDGNGYYGTGYTLYVKFNILK